MQPGCITGVYLAKHKAPIDINIMHNLVIANLLHVPRFSGVCWSCDQPMPGSFPAPLLGTRLNKMLIFGKYAFFIILFQNISTNRIISEI